jgi:hypothetical protein
VSNTEKNTAGSMFKPSIFGATNKSIFSDLGGPQ